MRDANRSILRGMLVVGGFAFVGKLAGAAKEMAVAWRFGVGAEVDAYLFVFNLINWPVGVWASVLAVVLLPLAARIRATDASGLPEFNGQLLTVTALAGLLLTAAGLVFLPWFVSGSGAGLPPRTAQLAAEIAPALSWYALAGMLVSLYAAWIMSEGGHANTLLEGLPAVGVLVAVIAVGGIESLVWGTLAGALVQLAGSALAQGRNSTRARPRFAVDSPHWGPFRLGFGVMMLAQVVLGLSTIVDQLFAARLDEGSISSVGFSGRILSLVLTLVATAVSRATLPIFSAAASEASTELRRVALRWTWVMGGLGLLAAGVAWILAPWAVRVLFERGTFHSGDTQTVARVLRFSLAQLPFYCASLVLVSLHSSQRRYLLLLVGGVLALSVKTGASWALVPSLGVAGLMLSTAAMYGANLLLFLRALRT